MSARRLLKKVAASGGGEKAILKLALLSLDEEISGDIKLVLFDEYDVPPVLFRDFIPVFAGGAGGVFPKHSGEMPRRGKAQVAADGGK